MPTQQPAILTSVFWTFIQDGYTHEIIVYPLMNNKMHNARIVYKIDDTQQFSGETNIPIEWRKDFDIVTNGLMQFVLSISK